MKTIENKGFLTTSDAMGRSAPVKTATSFTTSNKINGFKHISYGTALIISDEAEDVSYSNPGRTTLDGVLIQA